MTTSGTTGFNLNLNELVEEAFERAGAELRSGYDLRTARRSLNLLTIEWSNRGYNLWTLAEGAIPLVQGQATYDLPLDTVDLVDHVIRNFNGQNQSDLNITRISLDTYSTIPNKNSQGRPIQVWIDRRTGAEYPVEGVRPPQITVWPVPDQPNYYTFVYWRLRRMQDAAGGAGTMDVPYRFLPAMVAGLAYYLSMKIPEGAQRTPALKEIYDEQFALAADEDREKATLRIAPRQYFI